jgi:DNA repair ATPase RecN
MPISPETLALPSGARFYSCALQVNPFEYLVRHSKPAAFADENAYNVAVVEACLANGIEVVGVADHYRIKSSRTLIAEARAAGLFVLPGFEAVTKDGVHFLCLFDPNTDEDSIERRIGECGIGSGSDPSPIGRHDALEFMETCTRWKAACIAAHVAAPGGLLKKLSGKSAVNAWRSAHLLACGLPGPVADAPVNLRPILENKNPDYVRERPVAVINAQDVNDPADLARVGFSTAVKMSEVGYEGLKQAFLDPESRIRLASDPELQEHTEFVALEWTGGFLDCAAIHFNENLNVLIGGRGSGKSTVVESIRYVLGLHPVGVEARKAHETIVKNVLRAGTQISLLVRSPHPAKREYLIERTVPNPPTVKSADGELLALTPGDVAPRVEVFGQHEISELARSPEERTRLLERFLDSEAAGVEKAEAARRLPAARKRVLDALSKRSEIEEKLAALPGLKETLARYEEAGLEDKLKEKSLLVREEGVLDTVDETVAELAEALGEFERTLPLARDFVSSGSLADLPNRGLLAELDAVIQELSGAAEKGATSIRRAIDGASERVRDVRTRWDGVNAAADANYQKTLRELQKTNIDGEEFIRLRRRIERLSPLNDELQKVKRELTAAKKERDALIVAFENAKAKEFRALERAAKRVSRRLKDRVRVEVRFQGNAEPLVELLRRKVGGRLSESFDILRAADDLSLRALAEAGRAGTGALVRDFRLPAAQAAKIADAEDEAFMAIEELELPSTTQLELNVAPGVRAPIWQALEDLSAGQKATAVLLLLLLESDAPLVVDQPEDDLDNRFITEGVVPKMREEKRRRQFVLSTHNANIPVLADAELIAGLSASGEGGQGQAMIPPEHAGSIDIETVRELVEEVLEGGKAAFELRRLKYGF